MNTNATTNFTAEDLAEAISDALRLAGSTVPAGQTIDPDIAWTAWVNGDVTDDDISADDVTAEPGTVDHAAAVFLLNDGPWWVEGKVNPFDSDDWD